MSQTKLFTLLLIFSFLIAFINSQDEETFTQYRCGVDLHEHIPKAVNSIPVEQDSPLLRRRLRDIDSDGFKKFNIYLDLFNIEEEIKEYKLEDLRDFFIDSMNNAIETLQTLLKVKAYNFGFKFEDDDFLSNNITYWDKSKYGTEASKKGITTLTLDIDLIIIGRFADTEELGNGTLASAYTLFLHNSNGQPIIGVVNINRDLDYTKKNVQNYFQSIILHEFTHILGFSKYYFMNYFGRLLYSIDKYNVYHYYIGSKKVLEVGKKYFNCSTCDSIELDNMGGDGTMISHWSSRVLLGDYMNGNIYTEEQVISEFTLALLEDSGYYKANYYTGGLMQYGRNKGCSFLYSKCLGKYGTDSSFENEFFDTIISDNYIDPSCSSGRQSRTYHVFWKYKNIPEQYRYFYSPNTGGYKPAEYCPVSEKWVEEEEKIYYVGSCSNKGRGDYGSKIAYKEEGKQNFTFYTSGMLEKITGEIYSDHSFCALSSLVKTNENNFELFSKTVRAVCYEMFCSSRSLTIKIHENYIVCPRAGGKINVDGYGGYLLCPDYNLICSGTTICNDMFDCVKKKSMTKSDSYKYDYKSKTSQSLERAEEEISDDTNNYELSEDGLCPQYCKLCTETQGCQKCKDGYGFVLDEKDQKIKCLSLKELNTGYFKNGDVYEKCIDNCDECFDHLSCSKCKDNYFYFKESKCIKEVENCEKYNDDEICENCKEDFAFLENNRDKCLSINLFGKYYYTKDEISYYKCSENIKNCKECIYDIIDDKILCEKCDDRFTTMKDICTSNFKYLNFKGLIIILFLFLF